MQRRFLITDGMVQQMSDTFTIGPWPAAPPPPPPPKRGRRRGFIWLAIIAVLGTAIGLLVAQPWKPLPLLAPLGVKSAAQSTTSAVVTWRQAPGSRVPDSWVVFRNGPKYATVRKGQTSFTDTNLTPGVTYIYRVAEASGTALSLQSGTSSVTMRSPGVRNLRQTAKDWQSVTIRWDPPAAAPTPDNYEVTDDSGTAVADVAGNVTTYTVKGLEENGGKHTYQVVPSWSGNPSHEVSTVTAQTKVPPLFTDFQVKYDVASSPGGDLKGGTKWENDWTFNPKCSGNSCRETLHADFQPPGADIADTPFDVTLKRSGSHYAGTTKAQIFACGNRELGGTNDTVNVDIAPGHTGAGGTWATFKGSVKVTMPYTNDRFDANMYCPNQTWDLSVTGS